MSIFWECIKLLFWLNVIDCALIPVKLDKKIVLFPGSLLCISIDGAFIKIVLPLIRFWEDNRVNGKLNFEKVDLEVVSVVPGYDGNGMQVD